uniref:Ubiquitin carboxyl-terminal hydrolase n=1 Tax=Trichuris muris TaxID=70415 RepID=A0A5S6QXI6_TRIMR
MFEEDSETQGLIGLRNMGNTCYMNSVLQALSNCPPLTEFMRVCWNICMEKDGMEKSQSIHVATEFRNLICLIWGRCPVASLTPFDLIDAIRSSHPGFRVHQQQDAQEFLRFFLDKLHDACKRFVYEWEAELLVRKKHLTPTRENSQQCNDSDTDSFVTCSSLSIDNDDLSVQFCNGSFHPGETDENDNERMHSSNGPMSSGMLAQCSSYTRSDQSSGTSKFGNLPFLSKKPLRTTSIVTQIFNGRLLSSVKCLHCQRVSEMDEVFQDLSLPIPSRQQLEYLAGAGEGPKAAYQEEQEDVGWLTWIASYLKEFISGADITLNDCFSTFFSPDSLSGDDMYQCEHCAKLRNGVKVCKLLELPEVLCLHVKRFRHDSYSSKKIGTMIRFPLHGLDLKQFVHKDCVSEITTYDLIAVISHSGVTEGGHYVAYCFNQVNCQWYSFDDDVVGRVDPYVVENVQAYILFYQKTSSNLMDSIRHSAGRLYEEFIKEPLSCAPFYVSVQWLARFNTFAEPGPVNNFDFLCCHGGVNSHLMQCSVEPYTVVSEELWLLFEQWFGGGPRCNRLERCADCDAYIIALNCRRALELKMLLRLKQKWDANCCRSRNDANVASLSPVNFVCIKWLRKWQDFVLGKTDEIPGPIDNSCLSYDKKMNNPKSSNFDINGPIMHASGYMSAKFNSCSCQVPNEVWRFLHKIYGGGPEQVDIGELSQDSVANFCWSRNPVHIAEPD